MKKSEVIKNGVVLILLFITIGVMCIAFTIPYRLNNEIDRVEVREIISGEYVNSDREDYVIFQVKYDDYSKLERYSIYDIVLKDVEGVEQPYIKLYLNRNGIVLNSELYY